jgi:hypothetical protein
MGTRGCEVGSIARRLVVSVFVAYTSLLSSSPTRDWMRPEASSLKDDESTCGATVRPVTTAPPQEL